MVKFLLDAGADYHERCYGNFMCPEDQKASRSDSFDHEWVNVQPETNYNGYEECYRLILARGANPDKQDTNGNTVLHMLVIYEKMSTFDMAYEVGAGLNIRNVLNLTPLTLAAKLARTEMFFHILNIEREIYWQIGATTCAAYPLGQVDTIDTETGYICKDSALNLVVFGEKEEHLLLLEGMLIDLLKTKWNTFVKFRFYRQFFLFFCYFLVSLVCFTLRPGPPERGLNATAINTTTGPMLNDTELAIDTEFDPGAVEMINSTKTEGAQCARFKSHPKDKDRTELMLWVGALAYVGAALREARFLGIKMFIENLSTVPSRGFKTVGPFVVMIYRMVMGVDDSVSNPMPSPMESIMAMFLMSLTSFSDYYVAILLVNMLIAMMGNTYQKIAETRNEWQRQWARIVLVVERGVPPAQRLKNLLTYSQPMASGKRALVLRINQK
ncbi:Nanchung, partial [Operophtera brumata]